LFIKLLWKHQPNVYHSLIPFLLISSIIVFISSYPTIHSLKCLMITSLMHSINSSLNKIFIFWSLKSISPRTSKGLFYLLTGLLDGIFFSSIEPFSLIWSLFLILFFLFFLFLGLLLEISQLSNIIVPTGMLLVNGCSNFPLFALNSQNMPDFNWLNESSTFS